MFLRFYAALSGLGQNHSFTDTEDGEELQALKGRNKISTTPCMRIQFSNGDSDFKQKISNKSLAACDQP
jgi:hypothetical protein